MAAAKRLADYLRPASFRGVPFQVDTTDLEAGRRSQLHEYPQRDKPYVEDLGRAARGLSFEGYVVGADYVEQANKLLAALEEAGPGTLVHPWFGSLTVSLKDASRVSFDSSLGRARFTLSFVESGELSFPSASKSTGAASRIAAVDVQNASVADFAKRFTIDGFQDFVSAAASGNITSVLAYVGGGSIPGLNVLGYANNVAGTLSSALGYLQNPTLLGWELANMLGISSYASTGLRWASLVRSLVRLTSGTGISRPVAPSIYTPSRQQIYVNNVATNDLMRQSILAQAVGASSLVGTPADTTPRIAHAEMMAVRDELTMALDAESLTASDAVYESLQAARGTVWQDLTERARDSARLATLTPHETTPALVLAYDQYEDATRDSDIVARNAIRHPGFVPPQPLKVLTR